jgi:hypothetical protein
MSDREILSWLSGKDRSVCGRFMGDQLDRNLAAGEEGKKRKWAVWNLLLAGLLLGSRAPAQTRAPRPETSQHVPEKPDEQVVVAGGVSIVANDRLSGKVLDSASGEPIPFATISMGKNNFLADLQGRFSIPAAGGHQGMKVTVTSVGYQRVDLVVDKGWLSGKQRVINLSPSVMGLMDVTVRAYPMVMGKMSLRCTTTVRRLVTDSLAFLGIPKKQFAVYPNPVRRGAAVTLSISGGRPGEWMVQLISGSGALVESMAVQGGESARVELLNIPASLAAGVYFIKMIQAGGDKVYTKELVIL